MNSALFLKDDPLCADMLRRSIAPPPSLGASGGYRSGRGVIALTCIPRWARRPRLWPEIGAAVLLLLLKDIAERLVLPVLCRRFHGEWKRRDGKSAGNLPTGLYVGKSSIPRRLPSIAPNLANAGIRTVADCARRTPRTPQERQQNL